MLEINWRSRFGNRDIDVRAMIEGTNGATEETLTRVNKYIRRLLNVVEVPIYGVAVLLILIFGELNFFSTQVRYQTEPMSSIGKIYPLPIEVTQIADIFLTLRRAVGRFTFSSIVSYFECLAGV